MEHDTVRALHWTGETLVLLDQRRLPHEIQYKECASAADVADAIQTMIVRGAPAIGIAAAYGAALAVRQHADPAKREAELQYLAQARPTAANLHWALQRMRAKLANGADAETMAAEACRVHAEDVRANHYMGQLGMGYFTVKGAVLTHCNTGSLATGGYGTALGVIRAAYAAGRVSCVYVDETRPWLQGARLTAWELQQEGIPVRLLVDAAAAALLRLESVRWVVVGADRVAANGDVANKIGTYGLALAAKAQGIGFMVVAPGSTLDFATVDGDAIRVEQRDPDEVLAFGGQLLAPAGVTAWNPVFDITPAELVDVLVTERGAVERPNRERMAALRA
ncbi:S-methyl-5-thioribose-1-phosphate isomerase [Nitrococcus mobilis]|uniref:Methylthioribose-1-phosphate isomerase n=1 Tax=Nitrococcus mobilis Nb-231 TaxID=314278 RepID=A4BM44_9GAMM|nr:S-methyl-5-thioribose-1-phosphate isomerase [Nitrococcus mobilis]EAR23382.1 Initiation factor 2B alpha/beta/delta [Nitrococcus mobilis Nb-231]